jgi:hypothetical protein
MAEIALIICVVSSLSASMGGGFYMFKKEQENAAKEELIAEKKASPYVTVYTECDYKGDEHVIGKPENSGDVFVKADITAGANKPFKSMIVPAGFSVDTYPNENKGGAKLTLGGPSDQKCTSIKSMVVTKVGAGDMITTDTGDCDPSRPGGCEITI